MQCNGVHSSRSKDVCVVYSTQAGLEPPTFSFSVSVAPVQGNHVLYVCITADLGPPLLSHTHTHTHTHTHKHTPQDFQLLRFPMPSARRGSLKVDTKGLDY